MSTIFSTDGLGNWTRTDYPEQCTEEITLGGQCQREAGHEGHHWCYDGNGDFCQRYVYPADHVDGPFDIAVSQTPPDHPKYKHPAEMRRDYWLAKRMIEVVTDPELIARLERRELQPGESITRPAKPRPK